MDGIVERAGTESDWPRLTRLQMAVRAANPHADHWGDLMWSGGAPPPDPTDHVRVWERGGVPVAFAMLVPFATPWLSYGVHPDHRTPELEAAALGFGISRTSAGTGVRVSASEDDLARIEVQESLGFVRQPGSMAHLVLELDSPPEPVIADGFVVRSIAGEHEAAAHVHAHQEVWAPSKYTLDKQLWLMRLPDFRRDLNLLAVAPDGTVAGTVVGWLDPVNRTGEIEPLGVRLAYRGLGLGKALTVELLRRLAGLGALTAEVWGVGELDRMPAALYTGLGFRETGRACELALQGSRRREVDADPVGDVGQGGLE